MVRSTPNRHCEICERQLLPGETRHYFDEPDRGRRLHVVCPLCRRTALQRGWVRSPDGAERDSRAA